MRVRPRHRDVDSPVSLVLSVLGAFVLGFTGAFVVTPDPTGVLPVAVGVVLTGVLSPVCYYGLQRVVAPGESVT
jgi:hypothetical protein